MYKFGTKYKRIPVLQNTMKLTQKYYRNLSIPETTVHNLLRKEEIRMEKD